MQKFFLPLATLAVLASSTPALGHAVETRYVFDDKLELQSLFSNGEPFQDATVQIFSPDNPEEPWLEGKTDAEGKFSFAPDTQLPGNWEVMIKEKGHGDILTVPVDEQGVDVTLISREMNVHMHYMVGPLSLIGMVVAGGTVALRRRLRSLNSDA
jgi:nickel transport protein